MGGDVVRLDQGNVVDEEAQDALALAAIDARVLPDSRQLLCETENAAAHVCIECDCLLSTTSLVVCGGVSMKTQLVVPFRFEGIGDEAVVGGGPLLSPRRPYAPVPPPPHTRDRHLARHVRHR